VIRGKNKSPEDKIATLDIFEVLKKRIIEFKGLMNTLITTKGITIILALPHFEDRNKLEIKLKGFSKIF
jgi:hypothetical protein